MSELYNTALYIKERIYGNRIVLFAPLYLSNYCVNSCTYCAFRGANKHISRSLLTKDQLIQEVEALQHQGHRRLLMLTGEHPNVCFTSWRIGTCKRIIDALVSHLFIHDCVLFFYNSTRSTTFSTPFIPSPMFARNPAVAFDASMLKSQPFQFPT